MNYTDLYPEIIANLSCAISVAFESGQHSGNSIVVGVYLANKSEGEASRQKVLSYTCKLHPDSDLSDLVGRYAYKELHWGIMADWLDAHPNDLTELPLWLRYKVGPAFRQYHEARESALQTQAA